MSIVEPGPQHDPYAALRFRDFRLLVIGHFMTVLGEQMVSVAIGWELYLRTHSALALGGVGLVQVLPVILFSLLAGHTADQFDRKRIVMITQVVLALCSLGLALASFQQGSIWLVYLLLFFIGVARAFNEPANSTLIAHIVPSEAFSNAASWSTSVWQFAAVVGPGIGGLAISMLNNIGFVYLFNAFAALVFVVLALFMHIHHIPREREAPTFKSMLVGVRFLWSSPVLLAAITLDLFAVLFGGATTLLPVFATDILHVGAAGMGWMRAAPSFGAMVMAVVIAHLPPFRHAGRTLLLAVAGFGIVTIVFGLSRSFALSLAMLVALGALDNVSVVIRSSLLLIGTPDEMRGRVNAVNSVFIGASNELGGFESGVVAQLIGPIAAVVLGGIGTVLVVTWIATQWPQMRRLRRLNEVSEGTTLRGDAVVGTPQV